MLRQSLFLSGQTARSSQYQESHLSLVGNKELDTTSSQFAANRFSYTRQSAQPDQPSQVTAAAASSQHAWRHFNSGTLHREIERYDWSMSEILTLIGWSNQNKGTPSVS